MTNWEKRPGSEVREAARRGDRDPQFELAERYDFEPPRNRKRAFAWYLKAAKAGHPEAQNLLAECYRDGSGTSPSWRLAVKWSRLAAKQGQADAQVSLGYCYFYGKGVK